MSAAASYSEKIREYCGRILIYAVDSPQVQRSLSWAVLLAGLALWLGVQGSMMLVPLWSRALPPEPDDSVTYVLKTREMEECPQQDCPALQDLRAQFQTATQSGDVAAQRSLAGSRIFPQYHPLLSAILLGLKKLGLDVEAAYRALWTVAPFFFALAFAYLLVTLFGVTPAGGALILLAFKVFPETGLGRVVPSNIAMAMAVALWARIIARKGDAPWSIGIGAVALVTMHPIGRIYAVMAALIAMSMPGFTLRGRRVAPLVFVVLVVGLAFANVGWLKLTGVPAAGVFSGSTAQVHTMLTAAAESLRAVVVESVRLGAGLFGSFPIFLGSITFGLFVLPGEARKLFMRFVGVYLLSIGGVLLYRSSHPGDVIFRMWIPLIVVLFGIVAYGIQDVLLRTVALLRNRLQRPGLEEGIRPEQAWAVVVLAILVGYSLQMSALGGEQVIAATRHLTQRQPITIAPSQTETLLSRAKPGDRVLYTSMIIMPYYFVRGAMGLGAVYYHPAMAGDEGTDQWLRRPDLRFAVTYNPTVYHPTYEGVNEHQWWIKSPEYNWSPITESRRNPPIATEGAIRAARFAWIEIAPKVRDFPRKLRVRLTNPGRQWSIGVLPLDENGIPLPDFHVRAVVPAKWSGWLELELPHDRRARSFRIILPGGTPRFTISAIVLGDDKNHWPWAQRAKLTFMPKEGYAGPISVSFDPAHMLPPPLQNRQITVLNDEGSAVLFHIGPTDTQGAVRDSGLAKPRHDFPEGSS